MIGDRYELDFILGQGGMGAVWRGRDRVLGRIVAVKVIGGYAMAIPDMVARFRREAEVTSQVEHPHIVQCFDVIDFEHGLAMVLEFLDGMTFEQHVTENGPMALESVARTALVLATAWGAVRAVAGALQRMVHWPSLDIDRWRAPVIVL